MTHSRPRKKPRKKKVRPLLSVKSMVALFTTILALLFGWLGHELTNVALPDSAAPPTLYATQTRDDLRQIYSAAIGQARESVLLIVYSLTDPAIIAALKKKAEEGLAVSVICDAKASAGIAAKLGKKVSLLRRFSTGLMHQKIVVIDHTQTWIGSANMTTDSLQTHGNLVMAIGGEALARTIEEKASQMDEETLLSLVPQKNFSTHGQTLQLWFLPDHKETSSKELINLLRSAEKTIRVAMFTWTRRDFAEELVKAAKRGVKVETALDYTSAKGASSHIAEYLQQNKIPLQLGATSSLLHHKFVLIDDKILVNGSANWTKAAFTQNDECFVILKDLTKEQIDKMHTLWHAIQNEASAVY
jgi:phosphatidylserine/phosphatidylglycerophosphate/cardiolipin synthase-like enzyme